MRAARLLISGCLCALAGCAAGPDFARPHDRLPASYLEGNGQMTVPQNGPDSPRVSRKDLPAQWWELFHCEALNRLVEESLKHNPNVDAAQAALRSAQENVYAQQGAYFPGITASYAPTRQKVAAALASPAASGANYLTLHTAQVSVSYTIDVFGANRRQVESLTAQAEAQRYQVEATYLTLTSNVVAAAIEAAALRAQIDATKEIVADQQKIMRMVQRQFEAGQVADADVAAQEAALAAVEATLPPLEKQLAIQRDLLKALAGRFPDARLDTGFELKQFQLPGELPLSLPSALLEHRPDILAAEQQLHAASAQIGVAAANRLPNISLGISAYGSAASNLADLFKSGSGFWELAGGLTQPIFDGGTLRHRENAARAEYDQAAAQYRATVLNAFQNVADALQAIQSDGAALAAADKAEHAAARSLGLAQRQLELGDISTLALLSAQQAYQQAKMNQVQAQANRLSDTAALFQALGGGWWNAAELDAQPK
ncbi:MAG TPA: efflux transporter outer membrane subunit [Burkholderiaceae bacterium]